MKESGTPPGSFLIRTGRKQTVITRCYVSKHIQSIPLRCIAVLIFIIAFMPIDMHGDTVRTNGTTPPFTISTNMLYDAAFTPAVGLELSINPQYSFAAEGVWAWWSRHRRNRCWRIYGCWAEVRRWFGTPSCSRLLTGHHIGVYGSFHSYDFEFGHKGWQSPHTFGMGLAYGYSLKINTHLNIDFGIKAGYASGKRIEYIPQCGTYVSTFRGQHHYFGITGLGISLVWFPTSRESDNTAAVQ